MSGYFGGNISHCLFPLHLSDVSFLKHKVQFRDGRFVLPVMSSDLQFVLILVLLCAYGTEVRGV